MNTEKLDVVVALCAVLDQLRRMGHTLESEPGLPAGLLRRLATSAQLAAEALGDGLSDVPTISGLFERFDSQGMDQEQVEDFARSLVSETNQIAALVAFIRVNEAIKVFQQAYQQAGQPEALASVIVYVRNFMMGR